MKYALLVVIWMAPLVAQDAPKPPEPMKATIANMDKEPPPFVPDAKDLKAAETRATNLRHAWEAVVEMKMAEQGAKANFYNSAATLNNALATRANRW